MKSKDQKIINGISWIMLSAAAITCIVPLLMIISISFTSEKSIIEYGFSFIPRTFSTDAYKILFKNPKQLIDAYSVTFFTTIVGTLLSVIISGQVSYTLSRRKYFLNKQLSLLIYFTMLFSGGIVPTYILVTQYLHLKNSLWAIIILGLISPWNVFLLKSFFEAIPESLIESAKLDGASELRILYQIVLPLSLGGIATVAITVGLSYWNEWYNNMLYISEPTKYSLQYLLQTQLSKVDMLKQMSMAGQTSDVVMPEESYRMAICLIAAGPIAVIFLFFQKYFVKGVTVGAVKG